MESKRLQSISHVDVYAAKELVASSEQQQQQQQVANELSAQIIGQALDAIIDQLDKNQQAAGNFCARIEEVAREEEATAEATAAATTTTQPREMAKIEEQQQQQQLPQQADKCVSDETRKSERERDDEIDSTASTDSFSSSSSASSEVSDEHAGQQASEMNLRQIRMSALEDVLVCDQNRHSTESARRLFTRLVGTSEARQKQPTIEILPTLVGTEGRESLKRAGAGANGRLDRRGNSLSSRSSSADDSNDHRERGAERRPSDAIDYLDKLLGLTTTAPEDDRHDYGTIKLDKRCCSSSSSTSSSWASFNGNHGRTLICSLSPTSQLESNSKKNKNKNKNQICNHENNSNRAILNTSPDENDEDDNLYQYPIDCDEIRQCRAAFRENRRLIEQAQIEACAQMQARSAATARNGATLTRSSSQGTLELQALKSTWANSLGRRQRLPDCSHCQEKLYPVDKMDLDFTRATLNIHRNCFRCQVCSTLLRLETYASLDAKLYCPAHVKYVTPSR